MAIIYTQALLERATAYLAKSVSERRYDEGLSEIAQLLSDITGEPNGGCRQCQYSDYFARVRAYISHATHFLFLDTVSTATHTLKPEFANETFVHEGYSRPVVGSEMTAEDAKFFREHYPHAFSNSAQPGAEAGKGSEVTEVEPTNPLVPQADLEAEQTAHAATQKRLDEAGEVYAADKQKAADTLKTEKDAHKATKDKLKEAEKQVKDLTSKLEKLTKAVETAADKVADATKPADGAAE